MKNLATAFLLLFSVSAFAQGTLTVEVSNFKNQEGAVYLSIFDNEDSFLKEPVRREKVETIEGSPVVIQIADLAFGEYSISVMQDENLNGELDSGTFGIPQEGYGFSNNAKGMFGPPSYKDTKFEFTADRKMSIDLIHPPF